MNFVLWLVKRAWKPVRDLWLDDGDGDTPGWFIICISTLMVSILIDVIVNVIIDVIVYPERDHERYWVLIFGLCLLVWLCLAMVWLGKYLSKLHTQYRSEQPEREKPKRKSKRHFFAGEHVVITPLYEGDIDYDCDYFEEGETDDQR